MTAMPYTYHVGEKFHPDGSVRAYAGSTIICFADPRSSLYIAGEEMQAHLKAQPYGHKFALLPPDSFHMTVFSLIVDQHRVPEYWTRYLPLDTPLAEMDQFFISKVSEVAVPEQFRMVMTFIRGRGLMFRLSPADEATSVALREYRDQISRATGVRYPDHDTYEFHLTLAYQLIEMSAEEERAFYDFRYEFAEALRCEIGVFETSAPELTFFEDMFRFVPAEREK